MLMTRGVSQPTGTPGSAPPESPPCPAAVRHAAAWLHGARGSRGLQHRGLLCLRSCPGWGRLGAGPSPAEFVVQYTGECLLHIVCDAMGLWGLCSRVAAHPNSTRQAKTTQQNCNGSVTFRRGQQTYCRATALQGRRRGIAFVCQHHAPVALNKGHGA